MSWKSQKVKGWDKRGIIAAPFMRAHFKSSVTFFKNFRIGRSYRWFPDRIGIGEIRNDESDTSRRRTLVEVTINDPNSLMSFRATDWIN